MWAEFTSLKFVIGSAAWTAQATGTAAEARELTLFADEFKYRAQASSAQVAEAPVDWCVADLDAEEHEARVEGGREHEGEQ
jgi:hypothetical protein